MMNKFKLRVCFIILNYNSFDYTKTCINSLLKQTFKNFTILIIDNNSIDNSIEELKKIFHQIEIIKNGQNLGFTGGCNVGIKYALKKDFDFIFLLNNDTVAHPRMLENLIDCSLTNPKAGILTGKIYYLDVPNKIWYSGGKLNFRTFEGIHYNINKIDNDKLTNQDKIVDFASGCMLMVRKEVFNEIGLLDEFYFANYEDVDLCIRLKSTSYKIVYNKSSILWHKVSPNFNSYKKFIKYEPFMYYLKVRNKLYLISKFRNGYKKIISYFFFLPKLAKYFFGFILFLQFKSLQYVIYGFYDGLFKKNVRIKI